MKCDRETSHCCAAPISALPCFSTRKTHLRLWSVQGQGGAHLGRESAGDNLCTMLTTFLPALLLSSTVSDCEGLSHSGALDHHPNDGFGTKGAAPVSLKRMCSAQLVRLLLG